MAGPALQEAIRIVLETEGREGIDALRAALSDIGDVSAETVSDTTKLLDSLAGLNEAAAKASRFGEMATELEATTAALDNASEAALQLSLQIGQTEKPSKEMLRTYKDVRDEVSRLEEVQRRQAAAQSAIAQDLRESGVDTENLADANRQLRTHIDAATKALTGQVEAVQRNAEASRRQKQATAEADEKFRKMAQSGQAAAESLRAYRERASDAEKGTRKLSGAAGEVGGAFVRLRGVVGTALAFLGLNSAVDGIKNLLGVASSAETARRSLQNLYGGQEEGNRAFERLRGLARENGLAFNEIVETAKKLKAFGLDPLNGSLQALIDQNAAVGGSMQDLDGKVLALGQAWAKQKLQGEEILQLVERGVPVWELLQKATGKNVTELQKLSEAGKLGRDTISALVAEIGKANAGAASAGLSGLSGLIAQVAARWQEFLNKVADSGVTDYFRQQLQSLLGSTGNLDALAKRVATGIVSTLEALRRFAAELAPVGKAIAEGTIWLSQHAAGVVALGKAYLALKLANLVGDMARMTAALRLQRVAALENAAAITATSRSAKGLTGALAGIPKSVQIAVAIFGLETAVDMAKKLSEELAKNSDAAKHAGEVQRQVREQIYQEAIARRQLAVGNAEYRDTLLLSTEALERLTAAELSGYQRRLAGLQEYQRGQLGYLLRVQELGIATGAQVKELDALRAAMRATQQAQSDLSREIAAGTTAAKSEAEQFAEAARAKFSGLVDAGKKAAEAVQGAFDGLDLTKTQGIEKAAGALDAISRKGDQAAKAVGNELSAQLQKVSAEDLPRLAGAAQFAFDTGVVGAKELKRQVDLIDFKRLGVDIEEIKTGFSQAGRAAVDGFTRAVENIDELGLTAEQKAKAIAQAFDGAFRQASTKQELQALKQSLQEALSTGNIGFTEFRDRVAETDAKLAELGGSGKKMGDDIADGAGRAASALDQVGSAADAAASGTERAADSAEGAKTHFEAASKAGQSFALSLGNISQKAIDMISDVTQSQSAIAGSAGRFARGLADVRAKIDEQAEALQRQTEAAQAAAAADDQWARRRAELASRFDLLGADGIERLVAAEQQAEQVQKRRLEAQRRAQQEAQTTGADAGSTIEIARASQEQATALTQSVDSLLERTAQAAGALQSASTRMESAGGEIVIRVVQEVPPGALPFRLTDAHINAITTGVVRELKRMKGISS